MTPPSPPTPPTPPTPPIPLSVLDLATVASGSTPAQALTDTIKMATVVEQLGYTRMWVAEHHGMPAVASSAPAVLIAHLAQATTTLRVKEIARQVGFDDPFQFSRTFTQRTGSSPRQFRKRHGFGPR